MITITPNGNIKLYSGIRLDNTYQNALSFASAAARDAYFLENNPYLIGSWEKVTYQRVTSGQCDVEIPIGDVYTANYMAFQNKGFSNRWFYAFVTNVEYVNNITTRIYYEIDVLTTFYFDWNYLPSFVEREHTATDVIGDNLVPESIRYGELSAFKRQSYYFDNWSVLVALSGYTEVQQHDTAYICLTGNMVDGVRYVGFDTKANTFPQDLQRMLAQFSASKDDIVSIFMYPTDLLSFTSSIYTNVTEVSSQSFQATFTRPTDLDGYVPKNNKLFTYPYCYLTIDNGSIANSYRWEYFTHTEALQDYSFLIRGAVSPSGEIYAAPVNYKGLGKIPGHVSSTIDDYIPCFDERLALPPLPNCCYPIDSYQAWLAQTNSSRKHKVISAASSGIVSGVASGAAMGSAAAGVGAIPGALIGGVIGGVSGALGAQVQNEQAAVEAAEQKNHAVGGSNGTLEVIDRKYGITGKKMTLCRTDAKIIDDYFTMFGYAVNAVKTPQIRTRPHWNYIKTCGLNMAAQNVPADYVRKIKAIHDQGVTYWKVHDEIGNYALNNTV